MSKPVQTFPFPLQTPHTAARMLRGHRMGGLKDGWLLIYENLESPAGDHLVDELCIVMTADHRCLVRIVRKGRRPGCWDLLTVTGEQELDVTLVWAELVTLILPHKPSEEMAMAMAGVS